MYINTNISSIKAQNSVGKNNAAMAKAMERLSSGLRINSAADDAAGSAVSTLMSKQIGGMKTAVRNINDGISAVQTAESALNSIGNILLRMRDLSVQSETGTYSTADKTNIDVEFKQLQDEINHIAGQTNHNGIKLLDGTTATKLDIQMSDAANDKFTISMYDGTASTLLGGALTAAEGSITAIDTALGKIAENRANLGAAQNRLEYSADNLNTTVTNVSAARSRIQDADMTAEMSEMSKQKILSQAAMNMLGQANQSTQGVVQLLQQG